MKVKGLSLKAKGLLVRDRPVGKGLRVTDGGVFRGCEACEEHLKLLGEAPEIAEEVVRRELVGSAEKRAGDSIEGHRIRR